MENATTNCLFEDQNNTIGISLFNPVFYMDENLASIDILFTVLGVQLGLAVAGIIIFFKRLHSPRNFYLARHRHVKHVHPNRFYPNMFHLIGFVL